MSLFFRVWDTQRQCWADEELEELGKEFGLMSMDMEDIAIDNDGTLYLLDECGKYAYLPPDRFKVKGGKP